MTKDEALTLALEALEAAKELASKHDSELEYGFQHTITALREALAPMSTTCEVQPEQEPVAMARFNCWTTNDGESWFDDPADADLICDMLGNKPKVDDEFEITAGWRSVSAKYRVTAVTEDGDCEVDCISHPHGNTTPPKRQPLTDEVTDRCIEAAGTRWADAFVQWARHFKNAIEAAHHIKEQP